VGSKAQGSEGYNYCSVFCWWCLGVRYWPG